MAELAALVASIVTLTDVGFKIARRISQIADDLGTVGAQIKGIGTDLRAISLILRELNKRLKGRRSVAGDVRNVAAEILQVCETDLRALEGLLRRLRPLRGGRAAEIRQKARWVFARSRVASRRASLDSLKLTLTLFLHTLDFIESGEVEYVSFVDRIKGFILIVHQRASPIRGTDLNIGVEECKEHFPRRRAGRPEHYEGLHGR